jgi:diguanylate cyclase (GGDEF)-like protein
MTPGLRDRMAATLRALREVFATPPDPDCAARLQAEQFAALRRNTPGMMAANIGNALALLATFRDTPLATRALLWTVSVLLVSGLIFLRARRRPAPRRETGVPSRVGRRALVNALVLGSLWAAVPPLFFLEATAGARLMVISLSAGMLFGGAFALARAPLAATFFAGPIALASAFTLLSGHDADLTRICFVLGIYTAVLLRGVYVEAAGFRERVLSQIGAEREARTDPLTGLPNRLAFADALEMEFARVRRRGGGFLLLCVDLDDFKLINDSYGHPAGDELLVQAARRMRASLRVTDHVARLGGDEFAIVATDVSGEDGACVLAARIRACFDEPFTLEGRIVHAGASVGGALAPRDGEDARTLFKSADVALYRAKESGDWRLFGDEPEMSDAAQLERDMERALARGEFSLVFQPIVDLRANTLVGAEALLRWRRPDHGEAPPSLFIPAAEKSGLIHELGMWAAAEACRAAARFPDHFRISVNVSPVQLAREGFAEAFLETIAAAGVAPRRLEIEIGEAAMTPGGASATDREALKLSRAGLTLSLDDFGSGQSSLAQFCRLPLDRVKIDGPLARDVYDRPESAAIVHGVMRLARGFRLEVVAEGVETPAQLDLLRDLGVAEAQGYVFAPPMPLQELESFAVNWSPERLGQPPGAQMSA